VFAEIRENHRVMGNGTFKPSFGEGISSPIISSNNPGHYSLHFCMDIRSSHSSIRDHSFKRGPDLLTNAESLSFTESIVYPYYFY
jgi:hypothetical protein